MTSDLQKCIQNGVSRRNFLRTLGAAGAAAATLPAMAYGQQSGRAPGPQGAQNAGNGMSDMGSRAPLAADVVIISSNENPLGPAQSALTALCSTASLGGRYHQEESTKTVAVLTEQYGVPKGYVGLFPGSGGPLDLALMSNIGPDKPLVMGDPSYEQGTRAAQTMKAPLFPVKLNAAYAHDVKAMLAAHPSPGAYYIVNPNNPTGTMTPKADIVWLVENMPKGSVVIVDEAYHHFSNDESSIDLVAQGKDVIVLRTFSKIYGMAGLRAGVVIARPEYMAKFSTIAAPARSLASISITSAAAARASLLDKELVPLRRKINADVREETLAFMQKHGYKVLPGSQANFFMVDVGAPQVGQGMMGGPFQKAMMAEKVSIGRSWPTMPTYVRVTVGTKDEMLKFQTAFVKCMDKSSTMSSGATLHLPEYHIPTELYRGEMYS